MPINPEDLLARLQLNDDDLRDIDTTLKDSKEDLSECVICKEDIFDILREAERDNKGGMEGCLSLWVCELASCGAEVKGFTSSTTPEDRLTEKRVEKRCHCVLSILSLMRYQMDDRTLRKTLSLMHKVLGYNDDSIAER
ncbi:hypothetical protein V865_007604 [Kwoniella europaea PYCC6329]|uniref:Uncharacterized protein n=1 Tax=Kwoniella europaea PYCC6329 TaxID=1423913 RepID=A0AAX4KV64_9TREE